MKKRSIVTNVLLFLLCVGNSYATNWFVKVDGTGSGTSWNDAMSPDDFVARLQDGFVENDVICLAAGTYYPGTERDKSFAINKGLTLIGGFAPDITGDTTEPVYPSTYETIFSGDIDKNQKLDANNSNQIVKVNTPNKVVFKGITITGGYKTNGNEAGSGLDIRQGGNVELYYCKIIRNHANSDSGGAYAVASRLYCYKTVVAENRANNRGAGIRIQDTGGAATLQLESCLLANNVLDTDWGGAIQVSGSNCTVICSNTSIVNNTAGKGGAGINSPGHVYIISSTIVNNVCSNASEGHDIRCESTDKIHIINSIVSGHDRYSPNIYLNGGDKTIISKGNNVIGTTGGSGTYTAHITDRNEQYIPTLFGTNILSAYGGYPKTAVLKENIAGASLTELNAFASAHSLSVDVTKDQRGFNRPEATSVGAAECTMPFNMTRIERLSKEIKDATSNYVFVVAHRGDWRNAPENSVSAIEKAATMGVDMVEIDIQKTKDGNFVLMHDGNIDRTTNGKGNISDYTVEQLKQFRLRYTDGTLSDEQIPTLKEALLACKGKVLVNLDKGGDYLKEVIPILRETETEDHVLLKGGNSVSSVRSMLGSNWGIIYMPVVNLEDGGSANMINSFLTDFQPYAMEVSFSSASFDPQTINQNIINAGCRIWINSLWASLCGGHEDEKAMSNPDANWGWILDKGATIIQTDRPAELIQYLQKKGLRGSRGITIKKAPQGYMPMLDGSGSDPIWSKIESVSISNHISGILPDAPEAADHSASFKAFYTSDGIYIYGQRTDDVIAERGSNSSESKYDLFRIFFNPTGVKDTEFESPFNRATDKPVGDVYPQSCSTLAYVVVGDDNKVSEGMMKRWEVFGDGNDHYDWPQLSGDRGQKVIHQITDNGYTFEFFVPFSTIIPQTTVLGEIHGIPSKIGFNIESYDGDVAGSSPPNTRSMLSWNENATNSDARFDINTFGEMLLSPESYDMQMNALPTFANEGGNTIERLSNGSGIWGDYNNDGYLDLFCIGTNINDGWKLAVHLYKNNQSGGFTSEPITIKALREAACAWIDFNNDGNLDLIISGSENGNVNTSATILYKNLGAAQNYAFEEVTNTGIENISNENEKCYGYLAVGDYDNDGYTDILLTGQNRSSARKTSLYKNDQGSGRFILQDQVVNGGPLRAYSSGSVAFGDMDGDGYLDILSSGYGDQYGDYARETGGFKVYRNQGDGTFSMLDFDAEEWGTFLGQCSWADVNNDGFLDFIITGKHRNDSNQDINQAKIYINDGQGGFTQKRSSDANLEPLNLSGIDWADVNSDGYLDLVMNGSGNTSSGKTWVYVNNGSGVFYPYINAIGHVRTSAVSVGDYDNDGRPDIFICGYRDGDNGGSTAEIWRNAGGQNIAPNAAPSIPQNLRTADADGYTIFSWDAATDDLTPSTAMKYNFYLTDNDGKMINMLIPADVTTGFVRVSAVSTALTTTSYNMKLGKGTYTWGVQAIDNGKRGSAFATKTLSTGSTDINHSEAGLLADVYTRNGKIFLDMNINEIGVTIYDLSGKLLHDKVYHSSGYLNYIPQEGVYIIRLKTATNEEVVKLVF